MITTSLLLALAAAPAAATPPAAPAQASAPASRPAAPTFGPEWNQLVGEWKGVGSGAPGEGVGGSTFRFELDGHVLVRRSFNDTPEADGRPAAHHEDLLVLTPASDGARASAVYFDNEGHVIRYDAAWSAGGSALTFTSVDGGPGPRFRLTYAFPSPDEAKVTFEVAPPGGEFRPYVGGVLRRAGGR